MYATVAISPVSRHSKMYGCTFTLNVTQVLKNEQVNIKYTLTTEVATRWLPGVPIAAEAE